MIEVILVYVAIAIFKGIEWIALLTRPFFDGKGLNGIEVTAFAVCITAMLLTITAISFQLTGYIQNKRKALSK